MGFLAGLYVSVFGPSVRVWYRRKQKRSREKARRIEDLLRQAKEEEPSTTRRRARIQIAKLVARNVVIVILMLGGVVGCGLSLKAWHERGLRDSWTEILEHHDNAKKWLFLKTIREPKSSVCPKEASTKDEIESCIQYNEDTIAIARREILCQTRAAVAADQAVQDDLTRMRIGERSYRACMWEAGWRTEHCIEGKEDCVEIPFFESACVSARRSWLKERRNTHAVEHCQSFPPNPFQFPR